MREYIIYDNDALDHAIEVLWNRFYGDIAEPRDNYDSFLSRKELSDVLNKMPDKVRRLIELRLGMTDGRCRCTEELLMEFNITPERLRNIEFRFIVTLLGPCFPTFLRRNRARYKKAQENQDSRQDEACEAEPTDE